MRPATIALVLLPVLALGCPSKKSDQGESCARSADCRGELVCVDQRCVSKASATTAPRSTAAPAGTASADAGLLPVSMLSCEEAHRRYRAKLPRDASVDPSISAAPFGAVLNHGTYLEACGVPPSTEVKLCVAVQHGRAMGATATLSPPNTLLAECVAAQVRVMSFPKRSEMVIASTTFRPE